MSFLKYPLKLIDGAADRILAVLGAIAGAQLPAFVQHYVQRLGGHVDELQLTVNQYMDAAHNAGMTLQEYIASLQATNTIEATQIAVVIRRAVLRLADLKGALTGLVHANAWEMPFAFLKHVDGEIARRTWENFVPNIPTDLAGISYAAAGLFTVAVLYQLCKLAAVKSFQLFKKTEEKAPPKKRGRRNSP